MDNKFIVKNVLGVHGMSSSIEKKSRKDRVELFKKNGMNLELFQFNRDEDPSYESWEKTFKEIDFSNYDAIYANSFGCKAVIKYLYDNDIKVNRLLMVVPGKSINTIKGIYKNAQNILDYFNNKNLSNIAYEKIVLIAKDDEIVPYQNGKDIADITKSKFILLENGGHKLKGYLDLIVDLVKNGKN